jgi:hypothetical protein
MRRYVHHAQKAGFFEAVWKAGLAEYDDMQGIAWRWQSVDGAMMKAPLAQEAVGPNPTDRGFFLLRCLTPHTPGSAAPP